MPATPIICLPRIPTFGEELANSISHGLGLVLAIVGLPFLILNALDHGGDQAVFAASVFGGSAILVYLASTLYHAVAHARIKALLLRLDYGAIYLFIAGTYTPIALGVVGGRWGWTLFGVIWTLAVAGVIFKLLVGDRFHRLSTLLYVAMGWTGLIAIQPLWVHMTANGLLWLLGGGLAYGIGVVFFMLQERLRYSHFIWHLFVLGGSSCHFCAVLLHAS